MSTQFPAPTIQTMEAKKMVGKSLTMSLANNRTQELWKSFKTIPRLELKSIGRELYSLQEYDFTSFQNFSPQTEFKKWALVEVENYEHLPDQFETFQLEAGTYAVFHYIGSPQKAQPFFQYIFGSWLPNSEYELDDRPHFEVLGDKYDNFSPTSEEDIWIPVKPKNS